MSYWDTSCLVKLYTPEADSEIFADILAGGDRCVTCDLAPLEFWATVRRKESEGVLAAGEAQLVQTAFEGDVARGSFRMQPCDVEVRLRFHEIVNRCHGAEPPIFIRTNDALHLAAAGCAGETKIIATDKRLREAAVFLGFQIFPGL